MYKGGPPWQTSTLTFSHARTKESFMISRVFVTNGHLQRRADLFQAILYDLGMSYEGRGEQELRLALTDRAAPFPQTGARAGHTRPPAEVVRQRVSFRGREGGVAWSTSPTCNA